MARQGLMEDIHGRVVMALRPSSRVQNIAYTGVSAASTTFLPTSQDTTYVETTAGLPAAPSGTTHVRLCATTDCFVSFGPSPTASSTTSMFLPAGSPEYFPVIVGDQIAVIQSTAAGTLNIVECT